MTKDEALDLALEALESYHGYMEPLTTVFGGPRVPAEQSTTGKVEKAITAIKQAIAAPVQDIGVEQDERVFARIEARKNRDAAAVKEHSLNDVRCQCCGYMTYHREHMGCIRASKLAAQQQPVAWEDGPHLVVRSDMRERLNYKGPWVDMGRAIPDAWVPVLYTTPPAAQRQWVGLTRAECLQIEKDMRKYYDYQHECKTVCLPEFARAIEAKLKEKNT